VRRAIRDAANVKLPQVGLLEYRIPGIARSPIDRASAAAKRCTHRNPQRAAFYVALTAPPPNEKYLLNQRFEGDQPPLAPTTLDSDGLYNPALIAHVNTALFRRTSLSLG
jgi:hypothetical protein